MNPIKKLFNKLNSERKFKEAGPGHRLNESSKLESNTEKHFAGSSKQPTHHAASHRTTEEAQRAAAAALARIEQKQTSKGSVNWSLQATKAQARKELESENALKSQSTSKPSAEVNKQNENLALTVSGVYFKCPLIGPEILPKKEMENQIKKFLYEQYEEEKGLTACLMIHTFNKNKEELKLGVETLSRYLTNILDNPDEEKYRKVRVNNRIFQERIVGLEGAFAFLLAAGFSREVIDHEYFYVFSKNQDSDMENLEILKEALLSAEPILPSLDRNLKVLRPAQATQEINLPDDFFNLSAEEIKKEQEAKAQAVELMTQLRTKAMRERDEKRDLRIYKFTLIRIRFPDGIIIQGTFHVYEKFLAVKEFVMENLIDPCRTFHLMLPGCSKITEDSSSLLDLKLVPAVLLNFSWEESSCGQNGNCLKPEVLALLSDI